MRNINFDRHTFPVSAAPRIKQSFILRLQFHILIIFSFVSPVEVYSMYENDTDPYAMNSQVVPEMKWVLLDAGANAACTSNTDACANTFCYGLEYTPGSAGQLTSYTAGFFTDCITSGTPLVSNLSCVMTDNSSQENGCTQFGLIRMNCSGNGGSMNVTDGVPVIIHQVCFTLQPGMTINIIEDEVTDLTTSIDLPGNVFISEFPEFEAQSVAHAITVTSIADNGEGSLRDLINCAQTGSVIQFSPGLIDQTITFASGVINITKDLTLDGLGYNNLTLSGNNSTVIFNVLPGVYFNVKNIALKNGVAAVNGGSIFLQGNLLLQNVLLENNFENGLPKALTISNNSFVNIQGSVQMKN